MRLESRFGLYEGLIPFNSDWKMFSMTSLILLIKSDKQPPQDRTWILKARTPSWLHPGTVTWSLRDPLCLPPPQVPLAALLDLPRLSELDPLYS